MKSVFKVNSNFSTLKFNLVLLNTYVHVYVYMPLDMPL